MHYTFQLVFSPCSSLFVFLFNRSQSKAGAANQMIHFCYRKRSTIGQFNVEAAMAEKENWYTLSNMIHIKF